MVGYHEPQVSTDHNRQDRHLRLAARSKREKCLQGAGKAGHGDNLGKNGRQNRQDQDKRNPGQNETPQLGNGNPDIIDPDPHADKKLGHQNSGRRWPAVNQVTQGEDCGQQQGAENRRSEKTDFNPSLPADQGGGGHQKQLE